MGELASIFGKAKGAMFESGDQDYESAVGWEPKSRVQEMIEADRKKNPRAYAKPPDIFFSRTIAEWLEIGIRVPPVGQLFGPFWLEEELTILFAGTGTGKSSLATQIAESLARGYAMAPFDSTTPVRPQTVLYMDFELNMGQLAMRYSVRDGETGEFGRMYDFSPNLIRTEMYWYGQVTEGYDGFSDMFFTALENKINEYDATVVIVDNITFLNQSSTTNANIALTIMRSLKQLKLNHLLSILVLAHTPKRRPWLPLTERDLSGSINLANFADSIFAIGRSRHSSDQRYLKQIKVRSGRPEHDAANVPVFQFAKYDHAAATVGRENGESVENFLGFKFLEFADEEEQMETDVRSPEGVRRLKNDASIIRQARKMAAEGKTNRLIADELGIPKSTAQRYVANG